MWSKALLQSGEEEQHVLRVRGVPHQADAPGFAFEFAQATADFDAEVGQELFADREILDAAGDFYGVELGELMAFLGRVFDS